MRIPKQCARPAPSLIPLLVAIDVRELGWAIASCGRVRERSEFVRLGGKPDPAPATLETLVRLYDDYLAKALD